VSTSFEELPDFLSAALKLRTETKEFDKVSQGYRVQSDVRRKPQLHERWMSHTKHWILIFSSKSFMILAPQNCHQGGIKCFSNEE
jgi:hypothetical protein